MAYSSEIREAAKRLYLKRWTPDEIRDDLKLANNRVIYYWADKYGWRDLLREEEIDEAISRRIVLLADIPDKTNNQIKELEMLINQHVRLKKQRVEAERKAQTDNGDGTAINDGTKTQGKAKDSDNNGKRKGRSKKNDVSHLTPDDFSTWHDSTFAYQKTMHQSLHQRIRNI